jgi:hypothetical protein
MRKLLEECLQLIFATGTFVMARWLFELSSPLEDWQRIKRWAIWNWLAHPDVVYHHVRAWWILKRAFS